MRTGKLSGIRLLQIKIRKYISHQTTSFWNLSILKCKIKKKNKLCRCWLLRFFGFVVIIILRLNTEYMFLIIAFLNHYQINAWRRFPLWHIINIVSINNRIFDYNYIPNIYKLNLFYQLQHIIVNIRVTLRICIKFELIKPKGITSHYIKNDNEKENYPLKSIKYFSVYENYNDLSDLH